MARNQLLARYYRPPFIGLLAFVVTLAANPIAHASVMVMRDIVGPEHSFLTYQLIGLASVVALIWGIKRNTEVAGTIIGFVAGVLLWTCWASYAFRFNMVSLDMPLVDVEGSRRPANLLYIQGSIGICIATMLFFIFNKDTRCNAFRWIQRMLRIDLGKPASAQERNFARITFLETIYVIWFCYGISLFLGDERFLGYHHPVTYAIVAATAIWGVYLLLRLAKFTRVMAAIRYAIPTKAIVWLVVGEFAPRYGLYEEFWLNPLEYSAAMWSIVGVFLALLIASGFLPQRKQA